MSANHHVPVRDVPVVSGQPSASPGGIKLELEGRVAVALVEPEATVRGVLLEHLRGLDITAVSHTDLGPITDAPNPFAPTIVITGPSEEPDLLISRLEELLKHRPSCGAVMLVFDLAPETVQQAFRAGIDDVVAGHANDAELLDALNRASARLRHRLEAAEQASRLEAAARAAVVAPADDEPVTTTGRVVTVLGTKGGTGKSVVAVNVAAELAQRCDGPVAVVDANLQFGDAAIMMQLQPVHTIVEAAMAAERLDGDLLADLLLRHKQSGVLLLAAPTEPGAADQIQRADLQRILAVLRETCAFVVVDTSPHLDDATLTALQEADDILMVATLDLMSLKNSRVSLQALQVLGVPFPKIKVVLNRTNGHGPLTAADAEKALQMKADAILPADELVDESVNRGVPMSVVAPESKFAIGIGNLADALLDRSPKRRRRGTQPAPVATPQWSELETAGAGAGLPDEATAVGEPKRLWHRARGHQQPTPA